MRTFLYIVLSLCAILPSTVTSAEENINCIAYWQLRGVGLTREGGIQNAIKGEQYALQYKTALESLKQEVPPVEIVNQLFTAMNEQLTLIDFDYDETAKLDKPYLPICPVAIDKP